MAWKLMKIGKVADTPYKQYVVETTTDIQSLPPIFGDRAFVIGADGDYMKTYICDSNRTWYCIEDSSESPVVC